MDFAYRVLTPELIQGKNVIEVGSLDVNGSLRPWIEERGPASYVGVDMREGPKVDVVAKWEEWIPPEPVDLIISTETLEHVENISRFIFKLKNDLKVGGHLLVTTVMPGYGKHDYPADYWRYTEDDMTVLFCDMEIIELDAHREISSINLFARKIRSPILINHPPHVV